MIGVPALGREHRRLAHRSLDGTIKRALQSTLLYIPKGMRSTAALRTVSHWMATPPSASSHSNHPIRGLVRLCSLSTTTLAVCFNCYSL